MGFSINDNGWVRIQKELKLLEKKKVVIGILGKSGQDLVNVGFWNEFGTSKIPARSFIFSTVIEQKNNTERLTVASVKNIYNGSNTVINELNVLGLFMESKIKKKITDLKTPANAPMTIRLKKSSNPLIDTGRMRASIAFEVRNI